MTRENSLLTGRNPEQDQARTDDGQLGEKGGEGGHTSYMQMKCMSGLKEITHTERERGGENTTTKQENVSQ